MPTELAACVRTDHYLQLVRGNLHLVRGNLHLPINHSQAIAECADYARGHVPFWDGPEIADLLTDRVANPLLRSYLWAYPQGLDWFVNLADNPLDRPRLRF